MQKRRLATSSSRRSKNTKNNGVIMTKKLYQKFYKSAFLFSCRSKITYFLFTSIERALTPVLPGPPPPFSGR